MRCRKVYYIVSSPRDRCSPLTLPGLFCCSSAVPLLLLCCGGEGRRRWNKNSGRPVVALFQPLISCDETHLVLRWPKEEMPSFDVALAERSDAEQLFGTDDPWADWIPGETSCTMVHSKC